MATNKTAFNTLSELAQNGYINNENNIAALTLIICNDAGEVTGKTTVLVSDMCGLSSAQAEYIVSGKGPIPETKTVRVSTAKRGTSAPQTPIKVPTQVKLTPIAAFMSRKTDTLPRSPFSSDLKAFFAEQRKG